MLLALFVVGAAAGIVVAGGAASSGLARISLGSDNPNGRLATDSSSGCQAHPTGTVVFAVTNEGKVSHDFKIAGKKTPLLPPAHSATLQVAFPKKGRYPYLSTVSGQAAAGMKGVFSVGPAAVAAPTPTPTVAPTTTTAPQSTTVGTADTTVTVNMFDTGGPPRHVLSQTTMPSGMVTFVITNKCEDLCSFDLEGIKAGALLSGSVGDVDGRAGPGRLPSCDVLPAMVGGYAGRIRYAAEPSERAKKPSSLANATTFLILGVACARADVTVIRT